MTVSAGEALLCRKVVSLSAFTSRARLMNCNARAATAIIVKTPDRRRRNLRSGDFRLLLAIMMIDCVDKGT